VTGINGNGELTGLDTSQTEDGTDVLGTSVNVFISSVILNGTGKGTEKIPSWEIHISSVDNLLVSISHYNT
jgi:hypothetical protein